MIHLKYVKENRKYQRLLDAKFNGIVVPIEKYCTGKITLKHFCFKCNSAFYGRPDYLLNLDIQSHPCINQGLGLKRKPQNNKINKSKLTDEMELLVIALHEEKVSTSEIARRLGVSRDCIRYHLKRIKGV